MQIPFECPNKQAPRPTSPENLQNHVQFQGQLDTIWYS